MQRQPCAWDLITTVLCHNFHDSGHPYILIVSLYIITVSSSGRPVPGADSLPRDCHTIQVLPVLLLMYINLIKPQVKSCDVQKLSL